MGQDRGHDYSVFPVDQGVLPIRFSSAVRLWEGFAPAWGIPRYDPALDELADKLYIVEWKGGGDKQHEYVGESGEEAGLGNYSKMLRNWVARVTGYLVERTGERAKVLDIGAGAGDSIIAVYKVLRDPEQIYATLLEPSKKKCGVMEEKLNKRGLKIGNHFDIVNSRDIDVEQHLNPKSQDIVQQVASVHHHRNRNQSFRKANAVTRMGGFYVSADWHSRIWMHPAVVYNCLLKTMEWPEKEEGMKAFLEAFPNATEALPRMGHYSQNEVETFARYWQAWNVRRHKEIADGNFDFRDDFFAVEGHCPYEVYVRELNNAGYFLNTPVSDDMTREGVISGNPDQIEPIHNLIVGMFAQKLHNLISLDLD
jgi:SAM-dependent methyltransferase